MRGGVGRRAAEALLERVVVQQERAQIVAAVRAHPITRCSCGLDARSCRGRRSTRARTARIERTRPVDVLGVDRAGAARSVKPSARQVARERCDVRPRAPRGSRSRGVSGEMPPQSLMPARGAGGGRRGSEFGGACTFMSAAEHQARDGDGARHVASRRLGRVGHRDRRLGAEVLDDHFLDVAVALRAGRAIASRLVDALGARLADAEQDAGGERDAQLAGLARSSRGAAPAPCRARTGAACRARAAAGSRSRA